MENLAISKTISVTEAGFNENWLQNQIWDNPASIGLGDLESVTIEAAVSSGGRLDILLKNPENDAMYEVEVTLGATDPNHIIRTIEYWDLIRRKWPQRQHFGIFIAERITKRYFNVIQILSNNVPLIAIQASIVEIGSQRSLHFTTILDAYEEPEDDLLGVAENIDEAFWMEKSRSVLNSVRKIYDLTKDIYGESELVFNKTSINISCRGYNHMVFKKRYGDSVLVILRYGSKQEEIESILKNAEINFTEDKNKIRFQIYAKQIEGKQAIFAEIAMLNKQWWLK